MIRFKTDHFFAEFLLDFWLNLLLENKCARDNACDKI